MGMKRLLVVSEDLHKQLKIWAAEEGKTITRIVEKAIEEHIKNRKEKKNT